MDLATMDYLAANHHCWLQRCSPWPRFSLRRGIDFSPDYKVPGLSPWYAGLYLGAGPEQPPSLAGASDSGHHSPVFRQRLCYQPQGLECGRACPGRAVVSALTVAMVFMTTVPVRLLGLISVPMPAVFGELITLLIVHFFCYWRAQEYPARC